MSFINKEVYYYIILTFRFALLEYHLMNSLLR